MSRNDPTGAEPEACPYVGLADDPRTRFSFPIQGHRCHVRSKPAKIDLAWQGAYCLSNQYPRCDRYRPPKTGVTAVGSHGQTVAAAVAGGSDDAQSEASPGTSVPQAWPTDVTTPRAEPAPPLKYRLAGKPERTTEPEFAEQPEPMPGPERLPGPEPVSGPEPEPENEPALASSPEPSPEAGPPPEQPGVAAGQATPDAGSGLPPDWWQPEATHATAGLRPASPPPTAWKTATTSSVLASIIPLPEPPIVAPPSESETPDREPDATEAVAKPLPSWLTEATSAAVTVVPYPKTEEPAEAPAAGQATAAADASSDRTAQTTDSTAQPAGRRRSRRRRALILLLLLVVLAGAALAVAAATGSLDRFRPAGLLGGAVAPSSATPTETRLGDRSSPLVSVAITAAAAPAPAATPSSSLPADPPPSLSGAVAPLLVHVVKAGESLTSIAADYGVTPQAIRRANRIKDANLLQIGQKPIIPVAP